MNAQPEAAAISTVEDHNPQRAFKQKVMIVDDMPEGCWVMSNLVQRAGYAALTASNGPDALELFSTDKPDLVMLDVCMPTMNGFEVLAQLRARDHSVPVIMLTAYGKTDDAVRAIRGGAFDYVTRPFNNDELLLTLNRALDDRALRSRSRAVAVDGSAVSELTELMGRGSAVRRIVAEVEQVGPTSFPVLITGETGTGKELVARAVHAASPRAAKPFVVVDCGAIAETLLESELFGHEKGSFTGAVHAKVGAFELADGGTIFLDEIGNLPLQTQSALLRVLETRRVHRVGGIHEKQIDFRVVAATNADLRATVDQHSFRWDLYHRLAGFTIRLPTLRDRREDVPFLVARFVAEANRELARDVCGLSAAAWRAVDAYGWPGNVRELRNRVRRAVLMCAGTDELIIPESFGGLGQASPDLLPVTGASAAASVSPAGQAEWTMRFAGDRLAAGEPLADIIAAMSAELESAILRKKLEQTNGNRSEAARQLHIDYKTLQSKLRKYAIGHAAPHAAEYSEANTAGQWPSAPAAVAPPVQPRSRHRPGEPT